MVIVRVSGGLGNQMFQYAAGRRLAIDNDTELKIDTTFINHRVAMPNFLRPHFVFRTFDLDVFNIQATIAKPEDMKWWQRPILSGKVMVGIDAVLRKIHILPGWEKTFQFDPAILSLKGDIYLAGFWQSEKYFQSIRDTLLQDFTSAQPLPESSQKLIEQIHTGQSLCLFVRRADMADKDFHGALGMSYYNDAITYVRNKKNIDALYILSDDLAWCKEHMQFDLPTTFIENEYKGQKWEGHMLIMKECANFVIPNSTFAWWGAWLSTSPDKIVVAPKRWFGNSNLKNDDLIPKSWIRI
jgi:hypothetical protein